MELELGQASVAYILHEDRYMQNSDRVSPPQTWFASVLYKHLMRRQLPC